MIIWINSKEKENIFVFIFIFWYYTIFLDFKNNFKVNGGDFELIKFFVFCLKEGLILVLNKVILIEY